MVKLYYIIHILSENIHLTILKMEKKTNKQIACRNFHHLRSDQRTSHRFCHRSGA